MRKELFTSFTQEWSLYIPTNNVSVNEIFRYTHYKIISGGYGISFLVF